MSKFTFRNSSKTYFFNACFDKNQLKNLISWFIKNSGEKITVDFLETIKQIGFHQATVAGVSLGLDDLQIPSQKSLLISQAKAEISLFKQQNSSGNLTSVEKSQQMISTWNQTSEVLRKTTVQQFKNNNPVNPVYMMAFSGARGNISQVRQLVAMRGLMADPQGAILEFPIQSNFREGLTLTEYLISCYGARKGLVDTALRTATSGYLTRRLVDAAQHVIVSTKDCGTTQGLRLKNKDLEQHLVGRVLSKDLVLKQIFHLNTNQIITPTLAKLISKNVKEVFVRSPLTCQAENSICQLCYGWNLAHGNLVSIGEAVGVIAAQSIGEPGTQLTMRTFHTGGVGIFSDQAMKYFIAPYDGIIEYTAGLPGHFVRTPHGKIVYMLKNTGNTTQNIILKLKSFDTKQPQYLIKKQELPAGSILLVRHGETVQTGKVLAQSSQFKKSKQKMPESTYPVFSPIDGQIYFESMTILKQKQFPPKTKKTKKIQKKQNEIGPYIRTLKGLGAFWVFSSENQHEFHIAKTILRPGDLVSINSSLFQYDFYVANRSNFYTILKKRCLGLNLVSLSLQKINFHKVAYSMLLKNYSGFTTLSKKFENKLGSKNKVFGKENRSNQKEFLFFNKKGLQNFLIWFPKTSVIPTSGYFFNFLFYSAIKNNISSLSIFSSKGQKILQNNWFNGSFFYLPTKIQKWCFVHSLFLHSKNENKNEYKKPRFLVCLKNTGMTFFLKNHFKQSLLLQYHPTQIGISSKISSQNLKIKFFYSKQKNYIIEVTPNIVDNGICVPSINVKETKAQNTIALATSLSINHTDFLKTALNKVKSSISVIYNTSSIFFQEKKGWIYIPFSKTSVLPFSFPVLKEQEPTLFLEKQKGKEKETRKKVINKFKTNKKSFILEQGKRFDNLSFFNSKTSITYIPTNKIGLIKSFKNKKSNRYYQNIWYSKEHFLTNNSFCSEKANYSEKIYQNTSNFNFSQNKRNSIECFLYYKLQNGDFNLNNNKPNINMRPVVRKTQQVNSNTTKCFFFVSRINEFSLPQKQHLINQWNSMKKINTICLTNSPLFTKQQSTIFQNNPQLRKKFQLVLSVSRGWFLSKNIFKLLINLNAPLLFKGVNQSYFLSNYVKKHKLPVLGLNLFFYNFLSLPENISFYFEIFENSWVIPNNKITTSFVKITKDGEFRSLKSKQNTSVICILTRKNLVTLNLFDTKNFNKNKQVQIGSILRLGTEIFPGIASSTSGFILNKNFTQFTIRLGIPFLASARGIIHIFQHDLIKKNDLLVTLKSRRLQTEDIVQGIPKIEQLFEARETHGGTLIRNSVHNRLKKYFISSLKYKKVSIHNLHTNLSEAVADSLNKIQFYLVQSILQAYSSQGVKLSQKHIEIIVRQMTTRVRILAGGDSGLLPGELIPFIRIQKLNNQLCSLGKRPAIYEPIILGITKSVLQSESFLLSASFQEVSRVLVRSALTKKTDFLRGLHENVILGQLIPTGTGLVSFSTNKVGSASISFSKT